MIPHRRVDRFGFEDRDNFIRNLVTILEGTGAYRVVPVQETAAPRAVRPGPRAAVLPLDQIKLHCRIEPDSTAEDPLLTSMEEAARIHTELVLRKPVDENSGANIRQAMLVLIAHWYRNRESIVTGTIVAVVPLAYESLLAPEREYPVY